MGETTDAEREALGRFLDAFAAEMERDTGAELTGPWDGHASRLRDCSTSLGRAYRGMRAALADRDKLTAQLAAERDEARAETEGLKRQLYDARALLEGRSASYCVHCNTMFPKGKEGVKAFKDHIPECSEHPIGAARRTAEAAKALALRAARERNEVTTERDALRARLAGAERERDALMGLMARPVQGDETGRAWAFNPSGFPAWFTYHDSLESAVAAVLRAAGVGGKEGDDDA